MWRTPRRATTEEGGGNRRSGPPNPLLHSKHIRDPRHLDLNIEVNSCQRVPLPFRRRSECMWHLLRRPQETQPMIEVTAPHPPTLPNNTAFACVRRSPHIEESHIHRHRLGSKEAFNHLLRLLARRPVVPYHSSTPLLPVLRCRDDPKSCP